MWDVVFTHSLPVTYFTVYWNRQNKIKQLIAIRSFFTDYKEMFTHKAHLKSKTASLKYASSTFLCTIAIEIS